MADQLWADQLWGDQLWAERAEPSGRCGRAAGSPTTPEADRALGALCWPAVVRALS